MSGKPIVLRPVGDGWRGDPVIRHLPTQPTPLVDRTQDIQFAKDQLLREDVRLLTLVGVAGVGKTRLAVAIAGEVGPKFSGGACFVDLVPVEDPNSVGAAIARALGIRVLAGRSAGDELQHSLHDRDVLLVLDNFEHLLPAALGLAGLLESCPRLKLLVTSREPLHLRWEHCFAVLPLAVPDPGALDDHGSVEQAPAVQLFLRHAHAVNRHFEITTANARTVAEICVRLDGVPLAIEIAAGYSHLLTPEAILERLDEDLFHLRGIAPDRPARHRSLSAAIDWSYRQLTEEERAAFCRLGTFVGGFTLEAAEALTVGLPDTLGLLDALIDKSLVQVDLVPAGGESYRFRLTEAARACALEHVNAVGEPVVLRARHALYYLALAERAELQLSGPDQSTWYASLDAELDNVRAALTWATENEHWVLVIRLASAMSGFWLRRGHLTEANRWLEPAAARSHEVSPELRWRALDASGAVAGWLGDSARALDRLEAAIGLARELGDFTGLAHSLANLTRVAWLQGHGEWVLKLPDNLDLFRTMADPWEYASLLAARGTLLVETDSQRAVLLLEEALGIFRRMGDFHGLVTALVTLAEAASKAGEVDRAAAMLREALESVKGVAGPQALAAVVEGIVGLEHEAASVTQRIRLLAAVCHARYALGLPRSSRLYADYPTLARRLRDAAGEEPFAASWTAGETLTPDQIRAEARELLDQTFPPADPTLPSTIRLVVPSSANPPTPPAMTTDERERELLHLVNPGLDQRIPRPPTMQPSAPAGNPSDRERHVLRHLAQDLASQPPRQAPTNPAPGAATASTPPSVTLSEREREVLRLVAQGLSNKQIARALHLSDRTVKTYVTLAFNKLGADNRAHAAVLATQRNLI
jgi:predicted ATPase/DNA-binding CsgD family transcriptional regulator